MISTLLQTIEVDLRAGESWLENEAETVGLFLWNTLKSAFIAVGPVAGKLALDVLSQAVANAEANKPVEGILTDALNTAKGDALGALVTIGKNAGIQIIAGLQANQGK